MPDSKDDIDPGFPTDFPADGPPDFTGTGHRALDYDLAKILDGDQTPEVRLTAVRAVLEKFFLSSTFILPTDGVPDTGAIYDGQLARLEAISGTLAEFIDASEVDDTAFAAVRAEALTAKNFVDVFREASQRVAEDAAAVAAADVARIVAEGDPGDGLEDPDDPDVRRSVAIRAPFSYFPLVNRCRQTAYTSAVECGGCAVTVKETRGLQARWMLRRITTVVEPWFSRRRIINRFVWVIEWVPVEFIKTIAVRCCGDRPTTTVTTQTVLDRGLLDLWRCYD